MRIDLKNYNATPSSTFRIYRSYKSFTEENLPPILAELPATTESYLDNTVELNRLAYYRVSVVHNQSEIVGPLYIEMKKYYTGPQVNLSRSEPDMVIRGNAQVGRYGTLPLTAIYPIDQISTDFPNLQLMPEVDYQSVKVEKCIVDNKILFVPDLPLFQGSLKDLYDAGILTRTGDGRDDLTAQLYNSITTKVTQGRTIQAMGFTYWVRLLTKTEFQQLYIKLYPRSVQGRGENVSLANCVPHSYASPIKALPQISQTGNPVYSLTSITSTDTDWTTVNPLIIVLELVGRADTAFPNVDGIIKPTTGERMMYCGGELVNNRVHFFGGLNTIFTAGLEATTTHISFDTDGNDLQVHAPLPFGVFKPVTWTHNNKIYCFGGARKIGNNQWSYQELYNDVQVWEDNGTPEGTWSILPSNVNYGYDSCGTVYYDIGLDKNILIIFGGYESSQPGITSKYYYADVSDFDGNFGVATSHLSIYSGGAALKAYAGNLIEVGGTNIPNGYTNGARQCKLPLSPPNGLYMSGIATQGSELTPTKGGQLGIWRDTLFLNTSVSLVDGVDKYFLYQWAPNESRWLKITVSAAGLALNSRSQATAVFKSNRVYTLISSPWINDTNVSQLLVTDLVDPLETPLRPVNSITQTVGRIYPPFAKVST